MHTLHYHVAHSAGIAAQHCSQVKAFVLFSLQYICLSDWDHCVQWSSARVSSHQHGGGRLLSRFPVHTLGLVRLPFPSQFNGWRSTLIKTDDVVLFCTPTLTFCMYFFIDFNSFYDNEYWCFLLSVFYRINTPRKQGGLGQMKIPLLSDLTHQISKDYGVYLEDQGHTLRWSYSHHQSFIA